jgi:AraC-like DNA-binding protein
MSGASTNQRATYGDGIVGWLYTYGNSTPRDHAGLASGLEMAAQLDGDWLHEGHELGRHLYRPTEIHRINQGETWRTRWQAPDGDAKPGRQVGFAVYPSDVEELRGVDGEIAFAPIAGRSDRRFFELARWLGERLARGDEHDAKETAQVRSEILAYVRRTCEVRAPDPIVLARRELDLHLGRELLMKHIAEVANLHPTTFARKFHQRYGVPPVTYRRKVRLDHAGRLLSTRHASSVREIAEECGFSNLPFFYRQFQRTFHCTPAQYAQTHRAALGG